MSNASPTLTGARTMFQARRILLEAQAERERLARAHGHTHGHEEFADAVATRWAQATVAAENERLACLHAARLDLLQAALRAKYSHPIKDAWRFKFGGHRFMAARNGDRLVVRCAVACTFVAEGVCRPGGIELDATKPMADLDGQPYP